VRFPRRTRSDGSHEQALAAAREEAEASAGQAQADLAEQRTRCAEEKVDLVGPLRSIREANHFASIIEAAFRGES
jgi:hypothetical protein